MKRLLLLALLLANVGASAASGVCLVCPAGYDCSSGTPVIGGTVGQILVREGGAAAWKNVATVALQGPQGPQGAAASADNIPCSVYGTGNHTIENKIESSKCYCRLKSNIKPSCVSSWVVYNNNNGYFIPGDVCADLCPANTAWRSSAVW